MQQDREDYFQALERGDRFAALAAVKRLRDGEVHALDLIREVILPAQVRVGELWESGAWSVDQERAATAVNEGLVHWLCSFADAPGDDRPLVVVSCLLGEDHALPGLVVAEGLNAAGYQVHYVGGSPDPDELLQRVLVLKPRAMLFSGSLTSSLAGQLDLLAAIGDLGIPIIVGGRAFAGDARRATALGATAYAADVDAAVELLDTLPVRLPARERELPGPAEVEARWILDFAPQIRPYVVRAMASDDDGSRPDWWQEFTSHVDHLLGCLAATLVTGDDTIMVEVAEWLARVLVARGAPGDAAARIWTLVAEPLRGHPLARMHLAAVAPALRRNDGDLSASA